TEVCNLIDDNCNGLIDEGVQLTYYADADGDGYGNPNVMIFGCEQPGGYVADSTDCDDTNPNIHPGAYDIPNNGIDEDCNGSDAVTGIASLNGENSLSIYPNPSDGKFVIELPANVSGEALIEILNSLGQTVFEERAIEVSPAKIEMELNDKFSEGIYSVQVISGESKFRGRLVIGK
ncbi:MAG: MopE-related protein, partial [Chitinophagales bacterium]